VGPLIVIAIIGLFIVLVHYGNIAAKKRLEGLNAIAQKCGLNFNPKENEDIAKKYSFLNQLNSGSNRYAFNVFSGNYKGHDLLAFDFHYEEESRDSKGKKHTHDCYFSCFILQLPAKFPELKIGPETFFQRIGQALGFDDIDFESYEFSRKFEVLSKDKKFAYDICHPQMMEYLLSNTDLIIEIEENALAIISNYTMEPEKIEHNLNRLIHIRSLMPNYLFEN